MRLKPSIQNVVQRFQIALLKSKQTSGAKDPSSRDWGDAFFVLENWPNWVWNSVVTSLEPIFARAKSKAEVKDIPLDSIKTHDDWGRIPSQENLYTPIIVMELPSGSNKRYVVLDGQHRVFQLKRLGLDSVKAYILKIPLKYGIIDGRRTIVLDVG